MNTKIIIFLRNIILIEILRFCNSCTVSHTLIKGKSSFLKFSDFYADKLCNNALYLGNKTCKACNTDR